MDHTSPFAEVLEAIDRLAAEEQEALIEIVRRRVSERERKRLAHDVEESRREFEQGRCRPSSVDDLMDEILS
jgi:hypothetical protein